MLSPSVISTCIGDIEFMKAIDSRFRGNDKEDAGMMEENARMTSPFCHPRQRAGIQSHPRESEGPESIGSHRFPLSRE